jgi:hypothetical protein
MHRAGTLIEVFPEVAEVLAPSLSHLPVEDVETLLRLQLGVESIESFGNAFRKLKRSASQVTRAVPAAMPAIRSLTRSAAPLLPVAGQVAGAMIGGPAGAMIGGAAGKMAGQALGGGAAQPIRGVPGVGAPAPLIPGMPASAKLINILGRPEIINALTSMALGPVGNPQAAVGGRQIPVAAIANLVGSLAQQAVEEYRLTTSGAGEPMPDYLTEGSGTPSCDVGDSDERAQILYELVTSADAFPTRPMARRSRATFEAEWLEDWESEAGFNDAELGEVWANEALEWE